MKEELKNTLFQKILQARERIYHLNPPTPLDEVSIDGIPARIFLKREDLSTINAYKWRGAYNAMCKIKNEGHDTVVAASAGNHAQGVALSASHLGMKARIYMPVSTPLMKQKSVKKHGGDAVEIKLVGDTYNQAADAAHDDAQKNTLPFIHPFDDIDVIAGQGTIADEIVLSGKGPFNFAFIPIGGGGMAAGISTWLKIHYPDIKIIGVEGVDQASMKASINAGHSVTLDEVDTFCDGTAVKTPGQTTFEICQELLDDIITVTNEEVCAAIETTWELKRFIPEPSGAMGTAGLIKYAHQHPEAIKGKSLITLICGANMDFSKLRLISSSSAVGGNRRKYVCIELEENKGALLDLVEKYFGDLNIVSFQYGKISDEKAWPVIAFDGTEQQITDILSHMEKDGITASDITGEADTRYGIINYDPNLFNLPLFYHVHFSERSGALREFLRSISDLTNICYFNYSYSGETIGRSIMGFEFTSQEQQDAFLNLLEQAPIEAKAVESDAVNRILGTI